MSPLEQTPQARQNNPDHQLDQVLQALRHAEPALGMESMQQRILQHLATLPTAQPRGSFPALLLAPRAAWAAAALATVALTAAILFHHAPGSAPANLSGNAAPMLPMHQAVPSAPAPERASRIAATSHALLPVPTSRSSSSVATFPPAALPSFPAPAFPLTAQEQLLVRLAQPANRQQFAALAPQSHDPGNDFADLNPLQAPPLPQTQPRRPLSAGLSSAPETPPEAATPPPRQPAVPLIAAALINFTELTPSPAKAPETQAADAQALVAQGPDPQSTSTQSQSGDPAWQPALK